MFCKECGKELELDSNFCSYCGTKQIGDNGSKKNSSTGLGLLGLLSLIFVNNAIDDFNKKELKESKELTKKIIKGIDDLENRVHKKYLN